MCEERIVHRVPGNPPINPKERQGYIEDLDSKSRIEILELLDRQNNILVNKSFISKLPDKGKRIREFKKRLEEVLGRKDKVQEACTLLSGLSITQKKAEDIEWTKECIANTKTYEFQHNNIEREVSYGNIGRGEEEVEETDPLKILASQGNTGTYKKKKHRLLTDHKLVVEKQDEKEDHIHSMQEEIYQTTEIEQKNTEREEISNGMTQSDDYCDELYAKILCRKIDTNVQDNKKESFKPYCTNKSGVHPSLHIPKHRADHWEVTAATPPLPIHGKTKLITLQESMQLQQVQAEKLKEIQAKHASKKLAGNAVHKIGPLSLDNDKAVLYRDLHSTYDSCDSSDEERHSFRSEDEDEHEKQDTIVYTYTE